MNTCGIKQLSFFMGSSRSVDISSTITIGNTHRIGRCKLATIKHILLLLRAPLRGTFLQSYPSLTPAFTNLCVNINIRYLSVNVHGLVIHLVYFCCFFVALFFSRWNVYRTYNSVWICSRTQCKSVAFEVCWLQTALIARVAVEQNCEQTNK